MIKDNAQEFMQKLDFPLDAQREFLNKLDIILQTPEYADAFCGALDYYDSDNFDFSKMLESIKSLTQSANVCEYTAYMLLFICLAPKLHKRYIQKGISDEIFYATMVDLKYKLEECRLVYNKCGTFVPAWYQGFFDMKIFAFGRLQFEINHTWFDCTVDGAHIPKGTKVLSVHIPRTNTRLEHKLVLDSYKQAAEFFKDEFDNIIFICNSWLLYPWNKTVLKDGSNLADFYDDFTIVKSGEYKDYSEVWRLFDCRHDGNPDNLPSDSSFRRAYIERIKAGQPIGYGTGVIIYSK